MLGPLLATLLAQPTGPDGPKPDWIEPLRGPVSWELSWSDAEDRLQGTLTPLEPVENRPVEVSVMVGTFEGAQFDGPVTLTLRCPEGAPSSTVRRAKSERAWFARLTPPGPGACTLDIAFTSSRHKLIHVKVPVGEAPLSRSPWYAILAAVVLGALALGVRAAIRKPEPT